MHPPYRKYNERNKIKILLRSGGGYAIISTHQILGGIADATLFGLSTNIAGFFELS
jgi:hypothetical protein